MQAVQSELITPGATDAIPEHGKDGLKNATLIWSWFLSGADNLISVVGAVVTQE